MAVTAREMEERRYPEYPERRRRRRPERNSRPRGPKMDPRARRAKAKSRSKKSKNRPTDITAFLRTFQTVGSILLIFAMACGVVACRAAIADRGYELVQLRAELEETRARTDTLESRVASLQHPERIAEAANEMGMIPVSSASIPTEIQSSPAIVASTSSSVDENPVDLDNSRRSPSPSDSSSRIVLRLEDPGDSTVQMADLRGLGDWIIHWLKGPAPVEAHN
ncbi:MAG: hypothetical protein R6U92_07765 [Bacillota bacterium]